MKITPQKLAVLLNIKKKDARLKIIYALEKKKGNQSPTKNDALLYDKDPLIEIKDMSDHMGITLEFYVKDIRENFFKRSQTRGWMLNYPETKMKPNKKGEYPKSITVPSHIKCFLLKETLDEIIAAWEKKYAQWMKDLNVVFK